MRILLVLALSGGIWGCQKEAAKEPSPPPKPERPALATSIEFSKESAQIDRGFHEIEYGAWRWTSGNFAFRLGLPPRAPFGSVLTIELTVPEIVIQRSKDANLTCAVNGAPLAPQTWTQAGSYTFRRDVPATAAAVATVECVVAKAIPPGTPDKRELGIILKSVKLEAK
jgi:hypothetical protein